MNTSALGPVASNDNGDGTFTFQMPDGTSLRAAGPEAKQKHDQLAAGMAQMDPGIASAATAPQAPTAENEQASFQVPGLMLGANGQLTRGMPPPVATDAVKGPADPATAKILADLDAKAGIPKTIAKKPGAAGVAPTDLVGAGGGRSDQIPSVTINQAPTGPTTPGHMALAARSTSETKVPQSVTNDVNAGAESKLAGAADMTDAEKAEADRIADFKNKNNEVMASNDANIDKQEAARQAYLADRQVRLDTMTRKLQDMPDEHAPSVSITGAIGAALMAFGGATDPMAIINKKMDRAIDANRQNYAKAKSGLEQEKDAYGFAVKATGDTRQAELAMKGRYLDGAIRTLDGITADTKSALVQARGKELRGQLLEEKAKINGTFQKTEEHNSYQMTKPTGGGTGQPVYEHADVKKEEVVKGPDGGQYEFGQGATAQEAAKRMEALNGDAEDSRELQSIVSNPANLADPAMRARANVISTRMIKRTKSADNAGGGMRKEAIELLEKGQGGDPNAFLALGKSAGMAEYQAGIASEQNRLIQQYAVSRVRPFQMKDARTGEAKISYVREGFGPAQAPNLAGAQVGE